MVQFILSEWSVPSLIWGSTYMSEKEASKKTEEAPFPRIHMLWKKNTGNESKGNSESKIYSKSERIKIGIWNNFINNFKIHRAKFFWFWNFFRNRMINFLLSDN